MANTTSIKKSLLVNFLLIIVLLSSAITAVTFLGNHQAVKSLSKSLISTGIDNTESKLRNFFRPAIRELLLARQWGMNGIINADKKPKYLRNILAPIIEQYSQVSSLMVANTQGHEFMLLKKDSTWLNRITKKDVWKNIVTWYWWENKDTPKKRREKFDYDPRSRPWFKGAIALFKSNAKTATVKLSEGEKYLFWTEPYIFRTSSEPGLTAAVAFNIGDDVTQVIGFDILLTDISQFTTSLKLGGNGKVAVLTDDLKIIGLPQGSEYSTLAQQRKNLLKTPEQLDNPLIADAFSAFYKAKNNNDPYIGPFRFKSQKKVWIGEFRHFSLSDQRSLWIAAMSPEEDILGNLWQLRIWIIVVTLTVMAIAIFRAFVLARGYSAPIEILAQQSERISRGLLYEGDMVQSSIQEVQRLAQAHEKMRVALTSLIKLESDLQLARQIQQNTFPDRLPSINGFDIDAWSQPADETGGDTYDVIGYDQNKDNGTIVLNEVDPEFAILLMADATGHGIGAALSANEVRAMLRMAVRAGESLENIARHINDQLCQDLLAGRFITCWLGVIDASHSILSSFSAGQAPLLLYRADKNLVYELPADTYPFGINNNLPIQLPEPILMKPGDIMAIMSDGIFDTFNDKKDHFGPERVKEILVTYKRATCSEIIVRLRALLDEFTGDVPASDDQTVILIRKT